MGCLIDMEWKGCESIECWTHPCCDFYDNDNENKFIAKVVQRKALQNAVHGIHIKTDKQEKNILKNQLWQRGQK